MGRAWTCGAGPGAPMHSHMAVAAAPGPALATPCPVAQMAACHLGAPESAAPGKGASHPLLPFVLIQGPPGTGKTHTVKVGCGGG